MIKESRLRHGYGTFLMSYLTNKLSVQRRTNITIEVNERNVRAQLFFHKCGFIASPCGDVISMKYSIGMNDVWG
jgi:ribosomal protein S18 acetylase RimI-like enzyme